MPPFAAYPASVQELLLNGFPLAAVQRAYHAHGDDFDRMLQSLSVHLCGGEAGQGRS